MNKANPPPALELRDIRHSFIEGGQTKKKAMAAQPGAQRLEVLKGVNLSVRAGEIVALVGPSGSGKSTLLHIAGLLERPESGQVLIDGRDCRAMSDREWTLLRRQKIGFVFQAHHLLPEFTALENVAMPQRVALFGKAQARERAGSLLSELGLGARLDHQPMQLSGGEQQRVAIARALANRPKILLADEPTGNLDPKTSNAVFENLITLVRKEGLAGLIATHNMDLARQMDRTVQLVDGRLEKVDQATEMP